MKLKKRKLKFAVLFGVCWFALWLFLIDGVVAFQTLVDCVGSWIVEPPLGWCWVGRVVDGVGAWAVVEVALWLLVLLPTVAVYMCTKETK